jgi:UDP-GlcNAc:undecaprenyl-phosphate GlcNAc-1-phosphate transferase
MATLTLLIALFFAVIATPLVRQLAINIDFVARPRSDRAHSIPTPLMGGVALYLGLTLPIVIIALGLLVITPDFADESFKYKDLLVVLGSGTALAVVGLWDDWNTLRPRMKLLLEFLAILPIPLLTEVYIALPIPELINIGLTFLWFLYVINAFNYLDNMDGAASMTAVIAATFFTVIAVINEQLLVASLAAAVAGTSFGFLRYNLFDSKRKIFMGDVGSLFLGFILAVLGVTLSFKAESPFITWPVPVMVLGVPIFDTALVFISRTRRGQNFFKGGVDHTSHRLSRLGFGHYGVPFGLGLLGTALGCAAILVMHSDLYNSIAIQLIVAGAALFLLYRLELNASYEFRTGKPDPRQPSVIENPQP